MHRHASLIRSSRSFHSDHGRTDRRMDGYIGYMHQANYVTRQPGMGMLVLVRNSSRFSPRPRALPPLLSDLVVARLRPGHCVVLWHGARLIHSLHCLTLALAKLALKMTRQRHTSAFAYHAIFSATHGNSTCGIGWQVSASTQSVPRALAELTRQCGNQQIASLAIPSKAMFSTTCAHIGLQITNNEPSNRLARRVADGAAGNTRTATAEHIVILSCARTLKPMYKISVASAPKFDGK